ncbi:MAG: hypothetical protein H6648_04860 [Caldilineae bacterium]|nr:hypothetical protein [Chloroflexota bacterium]MCB9176471.1 hypothetical protein [Caldilineae bacterium]
MNPLQLLLMMAVLGAGFLLILIFFGTEIWGRVFLFQRKRRLVKLARYNPRNIWRRARKKSVFVVTLTTVRDFVLTLQLSLSLAETLAGALNQAALQFGGRGDFGQRLTTRVRSQLQVEPERVIEALAIDFNDEHLGELAERLEMAHEGGLSYAEAVNLTLDDIEEEIRVQVEKEIERAPVMLTIPMIIGVFFSALALLGFPLLVVMFTTVGQTTQ